MGNLKGFEEYSEEMAAKDADTARTGNSQYLKIAPGKNRYRFLPPKSGKRSPFRSTAKHFLKVNGEFYVFNCPRYEGRGSCPACEKAQELEASGNSLDGKTAKDLWPQTSVMAAVVDRANEDKGVQILQFGKKIMQELSDLRRDSEGGGNFTHPLTGFDIIIEKTGTGMETRYAVRTARESSPLHEDMDIAQSWIDALPDLEMHVKVPALDEIQQNVLGLVGSVAPPPPRAAPGRGLPAGKPRSAVVQAIKQSAPKPAVQKAAKPVVVDDDEDAAGAADLPADDDDLQY